MTGRTTGRTTGPAAGPAGASGEPLLEVADVVRLLRARCAWKAAQTHRSLARYLLEEAHEAVEAMDSGDADHLREELGDLLLQVLLHAAVAEESGAFTLDDVARGLRAKMIHRNPHVLAPDGTPVADVVDGTVDGGGGPATALSPAEVDDAWQALKAQEKQRGSVLDGLPPTLPALLLADKVLDRLARDPADRSLAAGRVVARGGPEVPVEQAADPEVAVGERLLAAVAEARAAGVDPEQALRGAVRRLAGGA